MAKLGEWFNANAQNADTENADLPQTTMGIAHCLDINDVREWQAKEASQATVEKSIMGLFMDPAGDFMSSFSRLHK